MVLQRAMSSTHSLHQFRKLKRTIRDLRKEKQVPPGKRFAELEDSVKNAILGAVLHRSPAIARYTEYWPVATYFDFDSKRHAARETRRAPKRPLNVTSSSADPNCMAIASKRARLSGLRHPSMAGPDKALSRPPRFFVGKPPPGVASQMVVHVDESRAFAMYVRARVGKPTNDAMPDKERSMALVKGGTALLAVSCTPPEEVNSSPPTKAPSIPGGRIDVKCPRCRYLPESSSPWLHNAVLRDVVNNPVHLRIFREMGLASDGHLHVLRGWSLKERSLLLDWVDPSLIKPWDKLLLLKRFQAAEKLLDLAYCAVEEAHRLPQGISQPGPEDEEQITDPGQPLSLLRKAMNIPEEHHFQQVINTMAAGIRDYLHSYFPSPDLLEATVKKVVASGSYFDRYENHWPIRFYIKRNVRRLRNKPLDHTGRVMLGGLNALDVPFSPSGTS
ncbi:hypothetical protein CC1G_13878 [Coprinopsis cinerea okayama7|uniref:Uncharacterized protein n=1 Tax=Coprinopsis cinerea (strain Okayama-7 / 130 / ATCC MYA-4618 / FGSC 9003) TaxID=240176 RepID=D6RKL6_COPC7|nr:hypothetical protein CC1G_13878 [Coprinopsis cinerea okayama7\|eukprot:XP_002911842.1 hypothetical protein CC1G_13878 [Coprinopsis cinerea okayama7\